MLLALTLQAQGRATVTVDLPLGSNACPSDGGGGLVQGANLNIVHGGAKTVPPLEVTLVSMNREEYQAGDPLVFEVGIRNRSQTPQRIPMLPRSAICDELDPNKPEYADAIIQLRVKTSPSESGLASVATLWASSKRKESWAILEPGQTALIRVTRQWSPIYFPNGVPERGEAYLNIEVTGTATVDSSNSIPIRVAR
jgi:hypothetical protein